MAMTLEDRGGGGKSAGNRHYVKCPNGGCEILINPKDQAFCTKCTNDLPRSLRDQIEDAYLPDGKELSEDDRGMLFTACLDELKQQRVEQVERRRAKRR